MYALVDIKGKQYKAEKGSTLRVDKLDNEKGDTVEFDTVLMVRESDSDIKLGTPYLDGVKITAVVEDQIRDKKVIVFKYKKRKGYRRKQGHRQYYSIIKVEDIVGV